MVRHIGCRDHDRLSRSLEAAIQTRAEGDQRFQRIDRTQREALAQLCEQLRLGQLNAQRRQHLQRPAPQAVTNVAADLLGVGLLQQRQRLPKLGLVECRAYGTVTENLVPALRGGLDHELGHALYSAGLLDAVWTQLLSHAEHLQVLA